LAAGKYSDVKFTLDQFKVVKERQKILRDFDHAFLTVFPDFVTQFNELFELKDQFSLKDAGTLNTELRIFALARLGIHNNEVIANALNYSINTIYTYKTKIRNKSLLENEAFDAAVLSLASAQNKA
jgi:DNA-binding NarL/FixJ family response regulator